MKTINYPKLRKPAVIITLLHILLMLSFFHIGITTIWYNFFFLAFFMYVTTEMFKYYTMDNASKTALRIAAPLFLLYYLYATTFQNIYFSYISAALFLFLIMFSIFRTIQKKATNTKRADCFLFCLLLATFVFTLFINIYQIYLLVKPF